MHVRRTDRALGRAPLALEPTIADDAARFTGEVGPVRVAADELAEVFIDGVEHEPGQHHGALTRLRLRYL